jgi:hypothetical protein
MGIEPMTPVLPRLCATAAPHGQNYIAATYLTLLSASTGERFMRVRSEEFQVNRHVLGGQWRIRTSEAFATDLQSVPVGHFGNCPEYHQFVLSDRRNQL